MYGLRTIYIGTHKAHHLASPLLEGQALFVSVRTLRGRRTLPRARCRWALDSGAFTEISTRGRWTVSPEAYVAEVRRYRQEIGRMDWAAIQDWMCEPHILELTGLSVEEHQRRTVESYLELRRLAPEVPWLPILQGWTLEDYQRHLRMYTAAGVDLWDAPLVGIGSICRRQGTAEAEAILRHFSALKIDLHAFGLKRTGLHRCWSHIRSMDSMAWSFWHRKHRTGLQNSLEAALQWEAEIVHALRRTPYRTATAPDWSHLAASPAAPAPGQISLFEALQGPERIAA